MRMLMINSVCGIRSTGRICTDLATALETEGHEVKIAYGREEVPKQFQNYAVRIGTDNDVRIHGLKARLMDGCGFGSRGATEKFVKWVKEYDPDVIHLHNLHGYYINIEVLFNYLRICGKKIIWTLHDCWAFTGHSAYCDAVDCEKWKEGCHDCPMLKEYPKSYKDGSRANWEKKRSLMTGIPDMTIVTPSEWLVGLVKESFLKDYSVKVINNGIDTSVFYPRESNVKERLGIKDRKMLLGAATSWNDMKGYSDFVKLSEMLDDQYQIVMIGLTKRQLKQIPDKIIGIERTNSIEEMAEIYSAADALLSLTYCENYPTINLEARACGTTVITYNTGGSAETVGSCGIVVNRGDLSGVLNAIHRFKPITDSEYITDKTETAKNYLELY